MIQRILRNGDTAEAHMLMAYSRMKAMDNKGAMKEVDQAIALNSKLPEAYGLRGKLAFIASDLAGAEAAFRNALALDPNTFDALLLLGTLLRQQGELKESHTLLARAFQLQPKEIRIRYQFALQYSAEGDDRKAAELLESLIKDAPNMPKRTVVWPPFIFVWEKRRKAATNEKWQKLWMLRSKATTKSGAGV